MEKTNGIIITLQDKCSSVVSGIAESFGWKHSNTIKQEFSQEANLDENNSFSNKENVNNNNTQHYIWQTTTPSSFNGLQKLNPPTEIINNYSSVNNLTAKPNFFKNSSTTNNITTQNNKRNASNNFVETNNLYEASERFAKVGNNVKSWSEMNTKTIRKLVEQKTSNSNSYIHSESLPSILNSTYQKTNILNRNGYMSPQSDKSSVTVNLNVAGNIIGNEEFIESAKNSIMSKLRKGNIL